MNYQAYIEQGLQITEAFVDSIMDGIQNPDTWKKPWQSIGGLSQRNHSTGHKYSHMNSFFLSLRGYALPLWVGASQAKALGGCIQENETPTTIWFPVVYYYLQRGPKRIWVNRNSKKLGNGLKAKEEVFYTLKGGKRLDPVSAKQVRSWFKGFEPKQVYNLSQTQGIELPSLKSIEKDNTKHDEAERLLMGFIRNERINFTDTGNLACYTPSLDAITMPSIRVFDTSENYYSTLAHECGHATGHKNRLARKTLCTVSKDGYAKDELVAEFTALFMCMKFGMDRITESNTIAYLQGWAKRIENQRESIYWGLSNGLKSLKFIEDKAAVSKK